MKFRYPRILFMVRSAGLFVLLVSITYFMSLADIDIIWLSSFAGVFALAILVVTVSPIFTAHELDEGGIILRQGVFFNARFGFDEVLEVAPTTGTRGSGRIRLAGGNRNLVTVKLRERRRFGALLWRSAKEIIVDLESPDEFVRLANKHLDDYHAKRGKADSIAS